MDCNSTISDLEGREEATTFLAILGFIFMMLIMFILTRCFFLHFCRNDRCVSMDLCFYVWLCIAAHRNRNRNRNRQRSFTLSDVRQLTSNANGQPAVGDLTGMAAACNLYISHHPHRGHRTQDVFETATENVSSSDEENDPQGGVKVNERLEEIEEQQHLQFMEEMIGENPENSSNLSNSIISRSRIKVNNLSICSTSYTSVYSSPQPFILNNQSVKTSAVSQGSLSQDPELPSPQPNTAIASAEVVIGDPLASLFSTEEVSDSTDETAIMCVQQSTETIDEDELPTQGTVTVLLGLTHQNQLLISSGNDEPFHSHSTSILIESDDTAPTFTEVTQTSENYIVMDPNNPASVQLHNLQEICINNNISPQEDDERASTDSKLTPFDPAEPGTSQEPSSGPSRIFFYRKFDVGFYEIQSGQSSDSEDYCCPKCFQSHNEHADCHCSDDSGNPPDDEGFPKV